MLSVFVPIIILLDKLDELDDVVSGFVVAIFKVSLMTKQDCLMLWVLEFVNFKINFVLMSGLMYVV